MRRKILKRLARLRAVPQEAVAEMLARPHGGFSLNAEVGAQDRGRILTEFKEPAFPRLRLGHGPRTPSELLPPSGGESQEATLRRRRGHRRGSGLARGLTRAAACPIEASPKAQGRTLGKGGRKRVLSRPAEAGYTL